MLCYVLLGTTEEYGEARLRTELNGLLLALESDTLDNESTLIKFLLQRR